MAIFGKPSTRKTRSAKPAEGDAKRETKVMSARELAARAASMKGKLPGLEPLGETSMRGASVVNWSTAPKAIEVAQANPGLCAVLENAALLFANGQDEPARALLEQGVASDPDTKLSPLAWLALFDLMQRAGDRAAFDQLAMQYVLQFERSAPSWDEAMKPVAGEVAGGGGSHDGGDNSNATANSTARSSKPACSCAHCMSSSDRSQAPSPPSRPFATASSSAARSRAGRSMVSSIR